MRSARLSNALRIAPALCRDCCGRSMKTALAGLLCASALLGADLTGIWVGQIPGRNGEPQDVAFKFTQTGTTLGGKLYGDYQSTPITEGKISGDEIAFVVVAPEQAGNQINVTRLRFTGSVKDGEIDLTRER